MVAFVAGCALLAFGYVVYGRYAESAVFLVVCPRLATEGDLGPLAARPSEAERVGDSLAC